MLTGSKVRVAILVIDKLFSYTFDKKWTTRRTFCVRKQRQFKMKSLPNARFVCSGSCSKQRLYNRPAQAKEPADDLVSKKKEIDAKVEAKVKEAKEFEAKMRLKACGVGNLVGKNVPVSVTEVKNTSPIIQYEGLINYRTRTPFSGHGTPKANLESRLFERESLRITKFFFASMLWIWIEVCWCPPSW